MNVILIIQNSFQGSGFLMNILNIQNQVRIKVLYIKFSIEVKNVGISRLLIGEE